MNKKSKRNFKKSEVGKEISKNNKLNDKEFGEVTGGRGKAPGELAAAELKSEDDSLHAAPKVRR